MSQGSSWAVPEGPFCHCLHFTCVLGGTPSLVLLSTVLARCRQLMRAGRMEPAREFQSRSNEALHSFDSKYMIFPIMLFLFSGQCCIQRRNGYSRWPRDTRASWRKRPSWTSWFWSARLTWWKGHPRCLWPSRASWCSRWVGLCVLQSQTLPLLLQVVLLENSQRT